MSVHLTERWASLHKQALTPRKFWHVTDRRDFVLDPAYAPQSATGGTHRPSLFVTPNPELWLYLWRYRPGRAMYAAEVEGPFKPLGMMGGDDRDQWYVSASDFDKVTVKRVVDVQVAVREARKDGYGFALIMADAIVPRLIHVIDHRKGYGTGETLCGGVGGGEPLKWTTREWVLTGPMAERICPDCTDKLRRQQS